jgi:hypothetical protein
MASVTGYVSASVFPSPPPVGPDLRPKVRGNELLSEPLRESRERCLLEVTEGSYCPRLQFSERLMQTHRSADAEDPVIVMQFYYSHTFPYLIEKWQEEIRHRLKDVPDALRQRELVPGFAALGETSGDAAWQVLRNYLDGIERCIAEIVRGHSPSFWIHLHRRLRPMLAKIHEGKTDDTTVVLVRRIAELAYAKYGDLDRTDDLGPIIHTRLGTFLDGAWYEATARALGSKLKAKKRYQTLKWAEQVVMTDFRVSDLCDVFGVEGLCYEYWWASAAMRTIGKGAVAKWDSTKTPSLRHRDTEVNPLCFNFYDQRNREKGRGFQTRLGTWIDETEIPEKIDAARGDQIHFAQLTPNPDFKEYPTWNRQTKSIGRGYGATNFGVGTFSLAGFKSENGFMAEPFKQKHGVELDAVLFAIWAASFFATYTGLTSRLPSTEQRLDRTMTHWANLLFRGYSMVTFNQEQFAQEAVWWAKQLKHERIFSIDEARQGVEFISLSRAAQKNIGLWSGGKVPILIPSMNALVIDLAAIIPLLYTIFFGLKKVPQIGGDTFENSVRAALRSRKFDVCLQGELHWPRGNPREVDVGVRIGDRLLLIECFSYELPLDYEVGKPSVFEKRKAFILKKLDQAQTLAERIAKGPKGTNFDVTWAKAIDWRVVSPFVEFAWHLNEPLFDEAGLPRVLQVNELLDNLTDGTVPAKSYVPMVKKLRDFQFKGAWY